MAKRPNNLDAKPTKYGNWAQERLLGSGAFGDVYMWKNVVNGEEIAIKKIKNATGDTMQRWQTEMRLIKGMTHPNIVSFIPIPDALSREYPDQYSLGMEYCSLGDLRKLMAKAEFCCGLPEYHVKDILSDIGSAIYYLHQQNNMHRDLKPENIVLKPKPNSPRRFQFKVTDLGYAKDLNNSVNSYAMSFVGTLPYLAPELIFGNDPSLPRPHYRSQVDYWSFGLVIFECITGHRPFFQHNSIQPMQVLNYVKDKKDEDICAWLLPTLERHFCDHIPQPHSLNQYFCNDVVHWLRLMLRVDGRRRGGVDGIEWHKMLKEDILPKIYVRVLNVSNMKLLTFQINEKSFMRSINIKIAEEADIPILQQMLLFEKGKVPDSRKKLLEQLREIDPHSPEYAVIYLFNKSDQDNQHYIAEIPQQVQQYTANSNIERSDKDERHIMKITLNDVLSKVRTGILFHDAFKVLLGIVEKFSINVKEKLRDFTERTYKTEGKLEFFAESIKNDLEEHETQDNSAGICVNEKFSEDCDELLKDIAEKKKQLQDGHRIIREAQQALPNSSQYSAYSNDLKEVNDKLQAMRSRAMEFYDNFRRESKKMEKKSNSPTNNYELGIRLKQYRKSQLQGLINEHWRTTHKYVQEILHKQKKYYRALRYFIKYHSSLQETLFEIQNKLTEYGCLLSEIKEKQKSQQHTLWNMLQHMKDVYNLTNEHDIDHTSIYSVNQESNRLQTVMDALEDPDIKFLLNPPQLLIPNDLVNRNAGTSSDYSSGGREPSVNHSNHGQTPENPSDGETLENHKLTERTNSNQAEVNHKSQATVKDFYEPQPLDQKPDSAGATLSTSLPQPLIPAPVSHNNNNRKDASGNSSQLQQLQISDAKKIDDGISLI